MPLVNNSSTEHAVQDVQGHIVAQQQPAPSVADSDSSSPSSVADSDFSSDRASFLVGGPPPGSTLPKLFNMYASSVLRKDEAETERSEDAHQLLRRIVKSVSSLEKTNAEQRVKMAELEIEVSDLREQLVGLQARRCNASCCDPVIGVQTRGAKRRASGCGGHANGIVFEHIDTPRKHRAGTDEQA